MGSTLEKFPQLRACYSQGRNLDELMQNIKEAIQLCLEEEELEQVSEFVGIQKVEI